MKEIDVKRAAADIKYEGFTRIPNFITTDDAMDLANTMNKINLTEYSEHNLHHRICYKREETDHRQGDAYMVSLTGHSKLPSLRLDDKTMMRAFHMYNMVVRELVGEPMCLHTRCMLNSQQYKGTPGNLSNPVYDHYDGEFFDFEHGKDAYGDPTLIINEGLLPRYVAVIVLYNDNDKGTYIRNHDSEKRIDIPNKSHDLIIFDNIRMRHGVPGLDKARMMIGFRNFDYYPMHFKRTITADEASTGDWSHMSDEINPGWIKPINEETSVGYQQEFQYRWRKNLASEQLKKAAAF